MKKRYAAVLTACLLGISALAFAEVANLTNSAEGANRDAGLAAVKKKLQDACTDRMGTPDVASFEVVFEKTSDNSDVPKPYYVDGKMKCDFP